MREIHVARSLLFVPATRLDRLDKAFASGTDAGIVDLEDAVAPADKDRARHALVDAWPTLPVEQRSSILIRINAPGTPWYDGDEDALSRLAHKRMGGVMVPKAEEVKVLRRLHGLARSASLVPLIESAEGVRCVEHLADEPGVSRLAFGHLDFQLDLGLESLGDEPELLSFRLAIVAASRRMKLAPPIDGVTLALQDEEKCRADAMRSRRCGFSGKLCIHPSQVSVVNAAMGPSEAQMQWARLVVAAVGNRGDGAFQLDGQMIDAPLLRRARAYLQAPEDLQGVALGRYRS